MTGEDAAADGDPGTPVQAFGMCFGCKTMQYGRLLATEGGASGGGGTVVLCISCDTRPSRQRTRRGRR